MDRLGVDSSRKAPVSNYRRLKLFDGCFRAREKLYLADRWNEAIPEKGRPNRVKCGDKVGREIIITTFMEGLRTLIKC